MNVQPKKTAEEMREYKRNWAREHSVTRLRPRIQSNQNVGKTHCIHGHEFTEENTLLKVQDGKEHRACKTCNRRDARAASEFLRKNLDTLDPIRREKYLARKRKAQLKRVGWTTERFEEQLKEQDNKCAICRKSLQLHVGQQEIRACADHKHVDPPKPRGILCPQCNVGIGNLQDSPEILEAAAAYLRRY